jgi:hypothetical protein
MPHVIIEGPASIERFFHSFEPVNIREDEVIMKVKDAFLNVNKMKALLECIVVEDQIPQTFYMTVSQKKSGQVSVHLDPLTDPEKNNSVKRLLAIIAHKLKSQDPACRYAKHNLAGFLIE